MPISCLAALIAATHGEYKSEKTRKDIATIQDIEEIIAPASEYNIAITATTLSFAIKPEIKEVIIRQSPRPIGANTGEINPAKIANILLEVFVV